LETEEECEFTPEEVVKKLLGLPYIAECEENVFQIMQKVKKTIFQVFIQKKKGNFNQMQRFCKRSYCIMASRDVRTSHTRRSKEKICENNHFSTRMSHA
jgi:hypothetical protein